MVLLVLGNLVASLLSHHGLNTSLGCSAGASSAGMDGVCLSPLYSTLKGFVPLARDNCNEVGMGVEFWFSCRVEHLREELTD